MRTKILSLFFALMCTTALFAYDCKVDGIYYNLNSTDLTAEVTNETGDWQAKSYSSSVVIPSTITYNSQTYSVTTIGNCAFYGCTGLTSVTIPNSVTTIGEWAFYECSGLTSVTIPNSVTTIGEYAFSSCTGLTSITIPNSVTTIGNYAFDDCSSLKKTNYTGTIAQWCKILFGSSPANPISYSHNFFINNEEVKNLVIPQGVDTIRNYAFYNCSGLTSVTIPNSVTTIGEDAFYGCSGLKKTNYTGTIADWCKIKFEFKVKVIGGVCSNPMVYSHNFFINDIEVKDLVIPQGVDTISAIAFYGCRGLTSITIPNSVTTIGERAFKSCSRLTSVTIPNSVTTIGNYAFYGCTGLTSVIVESGNAVYDNRGNCNAIIETSTNTLILGCKNTIIPNSVTSIGHSAFYCCRGLTSVIIPNSVTTIGNYAFYECSGLTSVTIGNSVSRIDRDAFEECSRLTSITCYAVTPPKCGDNVFYHISQDAKVYVPASALTDYQNAKEWKDLQLYPIAADVTPMDNENPVVIPSDQDVTITWPITDGTDTYTLTISKNGEVVCVLTFNANGQLTNIAFAAPGHGNSHQAPAATLTAQGYQFTVTGLNPGTAYNYSVVATDAGGKTIAEHKGNFSTTGGTGFESVHGSQCTMHKYLHNGQLVIDRNGQHYSAMGERVR